MGSSLLKSSSPKCWLAGSNVRYIWEERKKINRGSFSFARPIEIGGQGVARYRIKYIQPIKLCLPGWSVVGLLGVFFCMCTAW